MSRDRETMTKFCERHGIRATVTYGVSARAMLGAADDDWRRTAHPWTVKLTRRGVDGRRTLTVPFFTGPAITDEPTAADVLACLVSDANSGEMTFSEFCSAFGYDEDSRAAEATWRACRAMAPRVRRFLGSDFDDALNAEH